MVIITFGDGCRITDNIYKVIAYRVHARGTRSFCRILPSSVIRHRSAELDFTCLKNSAAKIIKKIAKCKEIAIFFLCKVKKVSLLWCLDISVTCESHTETSLFIGILRNTNSLKRPCSHMWVTCGSHGCGRIKPSRECIL